MHKLKSLRFWPSHSKNSSPVDSRDDDPISSSRSSPPGIVLSSRLPSSPGVSQQGNAILGLMQGELASQLNHASLAVRITPEPVVSIPRLCESVTQTPTHRSPATNLPSDLLLVPQHSQESARTSQQSLLPPPPMPPLDRNYHALYGAQNINDLRNVSVDGNMNTVTYTNTVVSGPNKFMKTLLKETIPGAAFDSSARDPPPRCHPGTRLAILERCVYFILNCRDERKIRWVFGAAGVGKSAIMQSIAETPLSSVTLHASIFFWVNGCSDGSKAIITLAYQLAVECELYRLFIERELSRDPSLLQKSMSVQFNKFIVEPFIHYPPLNPVSRVLITIDGLDECDNRRTQEELLHLISDLCITEPSSPLVWMIASRPEPHITSFFARANVKQACEKEEILVDSDEAREDVERFLRSELTKVQIELSVNLGAQWPDEQDFWKLAQASGGLFVYAHTVAKYIGDPDAGNPISQLNDMLNIIDAHPLPNISREEHPMAQLDALYARILSKVPVKANSSMRKLFLALVMGWEKECEKEGTNFIVLCNWLSMTSHEAYAAIRHLVCVLKVPQHDQAHKENLGYFHKSFIDYISDFTRSGFSPDIKQEAVQLRTQCALRILEQAPGNTDFGDVNYNVYGSSISIGELVRGSGTANNISLTWSVNEEIDWDDTTTRLCMYKMAIASVAEGIRNGDQAFCNVYCIRLLATRFVDYSYRGVANLHQAVFDKSRVHGFMDQGLVKEVPVKALNFADITWRSGLRLNRPITSSVNLSDQWDPLCFHAREDEWGEDTIQAWTTEFTTGAASMTRCYFCCQRLQDQLENWQTRFPDHPVLVLFTLTGYCFVEFRFIDQQDGATEWTYWLVHNFKEEKRKELGSIV